MQQDPILTTAEIKFVLYVAGTLVMILIGIFGYFGKRMNSYLDSIAKSMNRMEKDISVLTNDHTNLKDDHKELKGRVGVLEQKVKG